MAADTCRRGISSSNIVPITMVEDMYLDKVNRLIRMAMPLADTLPINIRKVKDTETGRYVKNTLPETEHS